MAKKLAIIIPAYKHSFLRQALDSIACQTCKDFTLYIGDDCSPYPIRDIVNEYDKKIDIVYRRFDTNLGGKDLVAQWERCIAMSTEEPYIWLFSDDDEMEPQCVASFLNEIRTTCDFYDIYHFDVKIINNNNEVIKDHNSYPQNLDCIGFYKGKLRSRFPSLVVENIFTREIYNKSKGFKNFDLAWGSDTATWTIFSADKGFYTIQDAKVLWRNSDQNITPDFSPEIVKRKVKSLNEFLKWGLEFFKCRNKNVFLTNLRAYINRMTKFHVHISDRDFKEATKEFCRNHHCSYLFLPLYYFIKNR